MKFISKTFENGHIKISTCGIKMSFNISSNYKYLSSKFNNKIYLRYANGKEKQIFRCPKGLKIIFCGKNASVYLDKNSVYKNVTLSVSSNSIARINKTKGWGICNTSIEIGADSELYIGEQFNMVSGNLIVLGGIKLHIGKNCMFSSAINIMSWDGHNVIDLNTQEIINKPQNITIGNKVWLGRNSTVLKGSKISDNSIVSFGAIVTSEFDETNVILGGVPAKIIKKGIDWNP